MLEGAYDFILKPTGRDGGDPRQRLRVALAEKLAAFRETIGTRQRAFDVVPDASSGATETGITATVAGAAGCRAVLLGCSTGGPSALKAVLPKLPTTLMVPLIVVQHMPAEFTPSLAKRLNELCSLEVREASEGATPRPGLILLAPGGKQLQLKRAEGRVIARLTNDPPEHGCRPSIDYLFRSAAETYDGPLLGVIMTGMGRDGVQGCRKLKERGGSVFAQHPEGCVVYGMPKATIEAGLANRILPLGKIGPAIVRHVKRSQRS